MAAPPSDDAFGFLDAVKLIFGPLLGAIFGAGTVYGATKSKSDNHEDRISKLEEAGPAAAQRLEGKIDAHHLQLSEKIDRYQAATMSAMLDLARGQNAIKTQRGD